MIAAGGILSRDVLLVGVVRLIIGDVLLFGVRVRRLFLGVDRQLSDMNFRTT